MIRQVTHPQTRGKGIHLCCKSEKVLPGFLQHAPIALGVKLSCSLTVLSLVPQMHGVADLVVVKISNKKLPGMGEGQT